MLDSHEGTLAQQTVLTFDSMHAFVGITDDPPPSDTMNHYASLLACRSKVSIRSDYRLLTFGVLQAKWKNPD